jgi:hypothetical protein
VVRCAFSHSTIAGEPPDGTQRGEVDEMIFGQM